MENNYYYEQYGMSVPDNTNTTAEAITPTDQRSRYSGEMTKCKICNQSGREKKQLCKLFEKATYGTRCMHLRFDEYCTYIERNK